MICLFSLVVLVLVVSAQNGQDYDLRALKRQPVVAQARVTVTVSQQQTVSVPAENMVIVQAPQNPLLVKTETTYVTAIKRIRREDLENGL